MKKILIIGATSAIAQETAKLFAKEGCSFFLVARDQKKLSAVRDDLEARGSKKVKCSVVDLSDFDSHTKVISGAFDFLSELDIAVIAHGTLDNQHDCEKDFKLARKSLENNLMSHLSLLTLLSNKFEEQKSGVIAVIGSVAGDRGRQSNYIYGTSKGALSLFLQGLRNRLCKFGVHVLTIKPGFVDTPMTEDVKKNFLFASPKKVGNDIFSAIEKKKNVLYTPSFWWFIMLIIKFIPERIFKKLQL